MHPERRPERGLPPVVVRLVRDLLTQQRGGAPGIGDQPPELGRRWSLIGPRGTLWVVGRGDEESGAAGRQLPAPLEGRLRKIGRRGERRSGETVMS